MNSFFTLKKSIFRNFDIHPQVTHISTSGGKNLCIANASILLQIYHLWEKKMVSLG